MANDPAFDGRRLMRAARVGTLATVSQDGHPFASLITPATAPNGALILLISRLSEHTRHLLAEPRCSVLVTGKSSNNNPQMTSRITVTGMASLRDDPALKARYLTIHPYAAQYADFSDFNIWQIVPNAGLLVAGFGKAYRLDSTMLAPSLEAVAAIAASEGNIIAHCNKDHAEALGAIAGQPGDWRMVSVDVDGFDLAQDDRTVRFHWSEPVRTSADVRRELVEMTRAALPLENPS
jgi:heme iron utilization protein